MEKIKQGIYRHFKGNLYFVLDVAWDREDPLNEEKAEVIYHPLYQVENIGWRRGISPKNFLEHIERPECGYSGPRFSFVKHYSISGLSRIILGSVFNNHKGQLLQVISVYERNSKSGVPGIWIRYEKVKIHEVDPLYQDDEDVRECVLECMSLL